MLIKNNIVYVYDIEIFPNLFHCTVKNTETKKIYLFEISERKNQGLELVKFFLEKGKLFCGYNNIHYDNPIINYLIDKSQYIETSQWYDICNGLYKLSSTIINGDISKWKQWKYAKNFPTLDLLTMLYSSKLRVGLKEMQITMKFHNVQEYDGDFNKPISINEIQKLIHYNINDVESTEELLYKCKEDINLRLGIEKEYGVDVLSKDGMSIGMEIIKQKYLEKTHKRWEDIKDLRDVDGLISLKDVIFDNISYKTKQLQDILIWLKTLIVDPGRKGLEKHFLLDGLEVSLGVGGIHSVNTPSTFKEDEQWGISDIDVASLYPSLICSYNLYPPQLGKEFIEVYSGIREERLQAKREGNTVKNLTLKLSLNGLSGNLQNPYNFCYSPQTVMKIRMNGQLMLLMLAESLIEIGCKIIQLNTDGIFLKYPKSKRQEFEEVMKTWESKTKLVLEEDKYEAFYQYAINDYLAISKGYSESKNPKLLKKKGLFIDKVSLGKGMQPMIIPKAINNYFANNIPVEDTVYNSKDINDFITYQKVNKKFKIEYNEELITNTNRYYVSKNAPYLYKCEVDQDGNRSRYITMLKGQGVIIVNNLDDIKDFPKDINYNYYIKEAKKIINKFECVQLTLFE